MTKLMCALLVILLAGCAEVTPSMLVDSDDAGDAGAPPGDAAWHEDAQGGAGDSGPDARVLILPDADGGGTTADGGPDVSEPDAGLDDGGALEPDASADPDGGEPPREDGAMPMADAGSDAGSDAGPMWVPGAMRPRPPVVYIGAPASCPLPSGDLRTAGWTGAMYEDIVVMDRWMEPCTPGDVYGHSVPASIATWCNGLLRAATTCAGLASVVADCRSCGGAWVDTVIDAGCPLDADLTATIATPAACGDMTDIRREGECRVACPYSADPPTAVAEWCSTWAGGALSCDDLYLSGRECFVCSELARELSRP
jgi:hypothetical protein